MLDDQPSLELLTTKRPAHDWIICQASFDGMGMSPANNEDAHLMLDEKVRMPEVCEPDLIFFPYFAEGRERQKPVIVSIRASSLQTADCPTWQLECFDSHSKIVFERDVQSQIKPRIHSGNDKCLLVIESNRNDVKEFSVLSRCEGEFKSESIVSNKWNVRVIEDGLVLFEDPSSTEMNHMIGFRLIGTGGYTLLHDFERVITQMHAPGEWFHRGVDEVHRVFSGFSMDDGGFASCHRKEGFSNPTHFVVRGAGFGEDGQSVSFSIPNTIPARDDELFGSGEDYRKVLEDSAIRMHAHSPSAYTEGTRFLVASEAGYRRIFELHPFGLGGAEPEFVAGQWE